VDPGERVDEAPRQGFSRLDLRLGSWSGENVSAEGDRRRQAQLTSGLKSQDNDLIVIESAEAAGRHSSARAMRDLSVVRLYRAGAKH